MSNLKKQKSLLSMPGFLKQVDVVDKKKEKRMEGIKERNERRSEERWRIFIVMHDQYGTGYGGFTFHKDSKTSPSHKI